MMPIDKMGQSERFIGPERLKLDRRIHNQRVALRENWMITDMRQRGTRSLLWSVFRDASALLDAMGIPRKSEHGGEYSIHWRIREAQARVSASTIGEG